MQSIYAYIACIINTKNFNNVFMYFAIVPIVKYNNF